MSVAGRADGIGQALQAIGRRIEKSCQDAERPSGAVQLVAVSKTHDAQAVEAALACGQMVFGENRVQEAAAKFPGLRQAWPDLRLHLIGGLQTNKAEEAVQIADVIESVDRVRLVDAIAKACDRVGRVPGLLVQVNTGAEAQKSGVALGEADSLIALCRARFGARLEGLMCIPPADADPVPHFMTLAGLASRHGLSTLSMGMSADFEAAIACGATHIRLGSAIFGTRE